MQFHADVDCTPQKARILLGLPDLLPLQATFMARMQERILENPSKKMHRYFFEGFMKPWMPASVKPAEQKRDTTPRDGIEPAVLAPDRHGSRGPALPFARLGVVRRDRCTAGRAQIPPLAHEARLHPASIRDVLAAKVHRVRCASLLLLWRALRERRGGEREEGEPQAGNDRLDVHGAPSLAKPSPAQQRIRSLSLKAMPFVRAQGVGTRLRPQRHTWLHPTLAGSPAAPLVAEDHNRLAAPPPRPSGGRSTRPRRALRPEQLGMLPRTVWTHHNASHTPAHAHGPASRVQGRPAKVKAPRRQAWLPDAGLNKSTSARPAPPQRAFRFSPPHPATARPVRSPGSALAADQPPPYPSLGGR
ncbi:hypothetical protein Mnod_5687 [Methylobacterium nodulans ORS 2060]|uniref:Uncharacterized protein n=1 Tax=Methylobacterium nodulans (strain LMG 21967 / CNCM I-2342 / ORS 2060) TaxID=460265 RepID=B8IQL2_METNO|nr:hypothetical protein Mnod_5687 [Methylobacterium nodulans ORS 2060]